MIVYHVGGFLNEKNERRQEKLMLIKATYLTAKDTSKCLQVNLEIQTTSNETNGGLGAV